MRLKRTAPTIRPFTESARLFFEKGVTTSHVEGKSILLTNIEQYGSVEILRERYILTRMGSVQGTHRSLSTGDPHTGLVLYLLYFSQERLARYRLTGAQ